MNRQLSQIFAAFAALMLAAPAFAQVPSTLLVEGVLRSNSGPAADGKYALSFAIYKAQKGGTAIWKEDKVSLQVTSGRFAHRLGSVKAVDAKAFNGTGPWFLGISVGTDPELPRQAMNSVPFAMRAAWADNVSCTGCLSGKALSNGSITAAKVGFAYAGAADGIKGGPAKDLKCSGCVSAKSEVKWDGSVNLGAHAISAAKFTSTGDVVAKGTVAATSFQGDGSKLTGIAQPKGDCGKDEAVIGIAADGKLKCKKVAGALPADGIDEVSNGLIHNQFQDVIVNSKSVPIKDNNPNGVTDIIDFPDIGIAQQIKVHINITNHKGDPAGKLGVTDLRILLFPPGSGPPSGQVSAMFVNNDAFAGKIKSGAPKHYMLHDKNGKGINYAVEYPKTKTITGDLTEWHGKNPKGKWQIVIVDTKYFDNKVDGALAKWDIAIKTLSHKKIKVSGNTYIEGKLYGKDNGHGKTGGTVVVGGDLHVEGNLTAASASKLWFPPGSRPFLFGELQDQLNGDKMLMNQYTYASSIPIDNVGLHNAVDRIVWGDANGNYKYQKGPINWYNYDNDRTQVRLIHFVKNTTKSAQQVKVCYWMSGRNGNNGGGIAINKNNIYQRGDHFRSSFCHTATFPASKTSVFALKSGVAHHSDWNGDYGRLWIGYYNNTWSPATLKSKGLQWDYESFYKYMNNTWKP